jgi:hypothetical protein
LLQSTVVYAAVGATTNGKNVLQNCQNNIKSGWFRGSVLERSLKKATDTWLPGDCEYSARTISCADTAYT